MPTPLSAQALSNMRQWRVRALHGFESQGGYSRRYLLDLVTLPPPATMRPDAISSPKKLR